MERATPAAVATSVWNCWVIFVRTRQSEPNWIELNWPDQVAHQRSRCKIHIDKTAKRTEKPTASAKETTFSLYLSVCVIYDASRPPFRVKILEPLKQTNCSRALCRRRIYLDSQCTRRGPHLSKYFSLLSLACGHPHGQHLFHHHPSIPSVWPTHFWHASCAPISITLSLTLYNPSQAIRLLLQFRSWRGWANNPYYP